jgi:nitroreductase
MSTFTQLEEVILGRRSAKPSLMNGKQIEQDQIRQILELGNWAPTHANTQPWRFVVFAKEGLKTFCQDHADLYKENTAEDKFTTAKYQNLVDTANTVSHIIAVYMKRTENAKIPMMEEYAAVAAATQNILLGAQSLGIAALWSTGGMAHQPSMKKYLGLADEDIILGLLHMGYTDEPAKEGKRSIPMEEKITWKG